MTESQLQRLIVDWIRKCAPSCFVFAVPNASRRTKSGRATNGVPGLTKGVSDLCILAPGKTLFAELKSLTGKVKDEQRQFGYEVQARGHHFAIWRTLEEARETFAELGIRTRERPSVASIAHKVREGEAA